MLLVAACARRSQGSADGDAGLAAAGSCDGQGQFAYVEVFHLTIESLHAVSFHTLSEEEPLEYY